MTRSWRIEDVIDLEYFLHQDETDPSNAAGLGRRQRDRNIYLRHIQPQLEQQHPSSSRLFILKAYLDQRRAHATASDGRPTVIPGQLYRESYRLLQWAALLMAGMTGVFGTLTFLNYGGWQPLNVGLYVAVFIVPQAVLLAILVSAGAFRVLTRRPMSQSLLYALAARLLTRAFNRLQRAAQNRLTAQQRLSMDASIGMFKGRHSVYGSLFFWPLFCLAQWLGIGFNIGVLGATLFKLLSADLAFGWQSTFQISSQGVYTLVRGLARPWSWFLAEPLAHPTLVQIEGSRLILKDGIYHLQTADLVSWWPFLCMMVVVYGLLPRLALLTAGKLMMQRILRRLPFKHSACRDLWQRLETPLVQTEGRHVREGRRAEAPTGATTDDDAFSAASPLRHILLVPQELDEQFSPADREAIQTIHPAMPIHTTFAFSDDEALLPQLTARGLTDADLAAAHLVILQEAWQPPIRQTLNYLTTLRHSLGTRMPVSVALIGKPGPHTLLTAALPEHRQIWHKKLMGLGDPDLSVITLAAES